MAFNILSPTFCLVPPLMGCKSRLKDREAIDVEIDDMDKSWVWFACFSRDTVYV